MSSDPIRQSRRRFLVAVVAVAAVTVSLSPAGNALLKRDVAVPAAMDAKQAKLAYKRRITDAKYRYKDAVLKAKQSYARNSDAAAYERSIAAAKKRYRADVHKAKEDLHRSLGALERSSKGSSR